MLLLWIVKGGGQSIDLRRCEVITASRGFDPGRGRDALTCAKVLHFCVAS